MRNNHVLLLTLFTVAVIFLGYYATRDWALALIQALSLSAHLHVKEAGVGILVVMYLVGGGISWVWWREYPWLALLVALLGVGIADGVYALSILTHNVSFQGVEVILMGLFSLGLVGMACQLAALPDEKR